MNMLMKPRSPFDNGFTLDFPPALLALPEAVEELPLPLPVGVAPEEMLPLGMPVGMPEMTPAAPTVGNATLGLRPQPLAPAVEEGHEGGVMDDAEAAYADEATPLGDNVAHAA